jgi:leucyl aminopeptidase
MDAPPTLRSAPSLQAEGFDALVIVVASPLEAHLGELGLAAEARAAVDAHLAIDRGLAKGAKTCAVIAARGVPGGRLVLSIATTLEADVDDVRVIAEAAQLGVSRAVDAGARAPLVTVQDRATRRFPHAIDVAALAALGSQWVALEAREAGKAPQRATTIGVFGLDEPRARHIEAVELGRWLCRDITGTEPERMAPRRIAALCQESFAGTGVHVEVEEDVSAYPLLAAVARASQQVERHKPCVVRLEWTPKEKAERTLVLCGKGVTYDTGGADLKTDGGMAGMSRDKGGAGSVAGFLRTIAALAPKRTRVIGLLGLVRNSIGEDAFVSDEIIKARSGVRVRIGNTDAEGRLVLADLLARAKEIAAHAEGASLFSLATLTGHVYRAYGPYVGALGNARARAAGVLAHLDTVAEAWGEPMEISRPRREDYALVAAKSPAEDVFSSNRLASVNTPRGHQFPFAFLEIASGLRGGDLPFVHLDLAGAAMDPPDWQLGRPTGTPIATLTAACEE